MASQAGATRQALTKSDIEQFNVPIPSLEIQDNVINRLNSQKEKVETIYESIEKELETIKSLPAALTPVQ